MRERPTSRSPLSGRSTSADVARLAGVSQSAVSRVFTDGASASAKTSAKVKEAAEQLGYRPNRLARSLLTGKSYMVGLVVAYLDNYFYPDVLEKLSKALQQQGYHVLIFMAAQTAKNIDNVVEVPYQNVTGSFKKTTFISQIGIYDEHMNLIGVAKVAKPVKKTEDREFTFKLKLDI